MESDVTTTPQSIYRRYGKWMLDRILGAILAIITLPLLLTLLVMAWIAFGWAPLQRVSRIGHRGHHFNLFRVNTRRDYQTDLRGRQLRFSRWLRSTSLDELPQLWNVALGNMSLVGPRPLPPTTIVEPKAAGGLRLTVRPGLTGPWQSQARGDGRDLTDHLSIDLGYLEQVSLKTDLGILLRTVPALVRHREDV